MTVNMSTNRRKAVFVLMMIFMYTKALEFWALVGLWSIYRIHQISIQSGKCGPHPEIVVEIMAS